jgi:hypothetical protein
MQLHAGNSELPAGELEFAGQSVHLVKFELTYLPAAQVVHELDAGVAYWPAEHVMQEASASEAFACLLVPATQLLQVEVSELSVKSTPCTIATTIAEVVTVPRYSSTTNTPAMSPLKN